MLVSICCLLLGSACKKREEESKGADHVLSCHKMHIRKTRIWENVAIRQTVKPSGMTLASGTGSLHMTLIFISRAITIRADKLLTLVTALWSRIVKMKAKKHASQIVRQSEMRLPNKIY